jgi:glycosyltransferase involved in cell wall biosynthesis
MKKDVLFLPVSGPRGASSRYRVFQLLPALEAAGWSYDMALPPAIAGTGLRRLFASVAERHRLSASANAARAVVIQKRLFPAAWVERIAIRHPLLFDFDDAIFTSPRGDRSGIAQRRVERRLAAVLSSVRIVTAGNRYLCDYARQYARNIVCLPTVVDTGRYPAKIHAPMRETTIGWIGHSVNHPYLADLAEVLRSLAADLNIRLLVVSDRDLDIPGVPVENRRWSENTEIADILRMDIGIMPMPDDPWSRGKCGLKAIQYMAAGIPVVCAAVGANLDIVREGVDGYLSSTPQQWREKLAALCRAVDLRQRLGDSARQRVHASYSLQAALPLWQSTLRELLSDRR